MPGVWTVVVAAGSGTRAGEGIPKQYRPLSGRRVLDWSLEAARSVSAGIVLVVPAAELDREEPLADLVVAGGETRSDSVRCGLAEVPEDVGTVLVHDAARPLASPALFEAVVAAVEAGADAAVPAVPVTDTIKRIAGGTVVETPDRSTLVAVQTPQGFRAEVLRRAHAGGGEASDDAALVEALGARVVVVPGDPDNVKVTHPGDIERIEALVPEGSARSGSEAPVRGGAG